MVALGAQEWSKMDAARYRATRVRTKTRISLLLKCFSRVITFYVENQKVLGHICVLISGGGGDVELTGYLVLYSCLLSKDEKDCKRSFTLNNIAKLFSTTSVQ